MGISVRITPYHMRKNFGTVSSNQTNSQASLTDRLGPTQIIAAIPCFNEEPFIGSVVIKTMEYVNQVIVIDDGSTDKTGLIAERAGAIVIKHGVNKGKGAAVGTAFEYVRNAGCKALVLLDGDGQHDPTFIPSLLKPVLEGTADMVVGSRHLLTETTVPRLRALGQHLLTFLTNWGSRINLSDSQSGFRAFSQKAINEFSFGEKGLSVESEMQFLANDAGLNVTEVPVTMTYRTKSKRNAIAHGAQVFNSILGLISRRIPLFFFGVPGVVMIAVAVWQGWRVLAAWQTYQTFWVGPALICVLLLIVGVLSVFTGLILNTIKSYLR